MTVHIRPANEDDLEDLVQLTLLAFEPIFASFARILGPQIYPLIYPDWRKTQREGVEGLCKSDQMHVYVAEVEGRVAGLIAYELRESNQHGEVQFLAVDPAHQNEGIGTELNGFVLQKMQEAGMKVAEVGTGGDESHAPARRSYEKAGYTALPLVRYYKKLS